MNFAPQMFVPSICLLNSIIDSSIHLHYYRYNLQVKESHSDLS